MVSILLVSAGIFTMLATSSFAVKFFAALLTATVAVVSIAQFVYSLDRA